MSKVGLTAVVTIKGIAMAIVLVHIANVSFVQGVVTAAVSAVISGGFLLVSTAMIARPNRLKLQDVKEKTETLPEDVAAKVDNHG